MAKIVTPAIRSIYKKLIKTVVEDLHKPITAYLEPITNDCPNCFVKDTKVNTPFGPTNIQELSPGDLVFDAYGVVRRVKDARSRKGHFSMTTVNTWGNSSSLTGTSDHKVFSYENTGTQYKPKLGARKDKKLSELRNGDLLSKAIIELPDSPLKYIEPKWQVSKFGPKKDLPGVLEVTDDFLYSFGFFLAEGCTSKGRQVQYCLNDSEEQVGERICRYWEKTLGVNWSLCGRSSSRRNRVFEIYSSHLSNFFDDYAGHLAHNKKIPVDLYYRLNKKQTMVLIRAVFDGDGHYEGKGRHVLTQTSEVLAHQVYNLLLSCGYAASISYVGERLGNDGILRRPTFTVRYWENKVPRGVILEKDRIYSVVKTVDTVCKEETVYNIQVEDSPTYMASGFSVHNCLFDFATRSSTGTFDSSFVTPVEIFGETIEPIPFSRSRCPVCYGDGVLKSNVTKKLKALVKWNPRGADDIYSTPAGRESAAVVRIKVLRANFEDVVNAEYFIVDGVKCELNQPPTVRGLGTQEELVVAYLLSVEVGSDVKG